MSLFERRMARDTFLNVVRARGLLIAIRPDTWQLAVQKQLHHVLFAPSPSIPATLASTAMIGPDPPGNHYAHPTVFQIQQYFPSHAGTYKTKPLLGRGQVTNDCPSRMTGYIQFSSHTALRPSHSLNPAFVQRSTGSWLKLLIKASVSFLTEELLIAQRFAWGTTILHSVEISWGSIGNAIPLPMAAIGFSLVAFMGMPPEFPPVDTVEAMYFHIRTICRSSHGLRVNSSPPPFHSSKHGESSEDHNCLLRKERILNLPEDIVQNQIDSDLTLARHLRDHPSPIPIHVHSTPPPAQSRWQ